MGKSNTKTFKVIAADPTTLEPLEVDPTKRVNPNDIKVNSLEQEIASLSLEDAEYRLEFEATDSKERELLKNHIKKLKK